MSSSPAAIGGVCVGDNSAQNQQLSTISSPEHNHQPTKLHSIEEMSKSDHDQQEKWTISSHNSENSVWRRDPSYRYSGQPEYFSESLNFYYNNGHNPHHSGTPSQWYASGLYPGHNHLTQGNEQSVYSPMMSHHSYSEALRKTASFATTNQSTAVAPSASNSSFHLPLTIDSASTISSIPGNGYGTFYPTNYSTTLFTGPFINSSPDSGLTSSSEGAASPHSLAPSYQPLSRSVMDCANQALLNQAQHTYGYDSHAYQPSGDFGLHQYRNKLHQPHRNALTSQSSVISLTTSVDNRTATTPSQNSVSNTTISVGATLPPTAATATPTLSAILKQEDNSDTSAQQNKTSSCSVESAKRYSLQNSVTVSNNNVSLSNTTPVYNWMKKTSQPSSGTSNTGQFFITFQIFLLKSFQNSKP